MSNISKSFASLVKFNNGLFKSEAQAKFLLDMVKEGLNVSTGSVCNNSYMITYICDDKGVVRTEKHTFKTAKTVVTWERREAGKIAVQDAKLIKKFKREVKNLQEEIDYRLQEIEEYNNGKESDDPCWSVEDTIKLFERTIAEREEIIKDRLEAIKKLEGV